MINKLSRIYFFSIVVKLAIGYELSVNYESRTAEQKQLELWDILSSATGTSAEFPSLLNLSRFVCCTNIDYTVSRYADTMPHENGKSLYSVGSVAKAVWTDEGGHPYTGLFKGQTRAIVRLSTLSQPDADGMTPALAIKLFRSGQPSANIVAMQSTEGQTSGNFFQETLSNHAPYGIADSALAAKFSLVAEPASFTGLSDVSLFSQNGALAAGIITFPYEVKFVPNQVLSSLFANRLPTQNLQEMFGMIPAGSKLYDVYALSNPGETPQLIANLRTTSPIITSAAGDNFLFFRHQKMEDDVKLSPEWTDEVYGGSNVLADIDFDNLEINQDIFNLTIPDDIEIPVGDLVTEELDNLNESGGTAAVGGFLGNLASNISNIPVDINNIPNIEGFGDIISQNIVNTPSDTSETSTTAQTTTTSSSSNPPIGNGSLGDLITQNIPGVTGLIPGGNTPNDQDSSTSTVSSGNLGDLLAQNVPGVAGLIPGNGDGENSSTTEGSTNTITIPNVGEGNLGDLLAQNVPGVAGLIPGNGEGENSSTTEGNTNTVTIPNVGEGNLGDLLAQNVPGVASLIPGNEDSSSTTTEENTNTINIPTVNGANLGDIISQNAPAVAGLIPGNGSDNEQNTNTNGGNGNIGNVIAQNIPDIPNIPGVANAGNLLQNNQQNGNSNNVNGVVSGVIANNLPNNQGNLPTGTAVALAGAVVGANNNENLSNANPGNFIGTITETISENNEDEKDEEQGVINGVLSSFGFGDQEEDGKKEKGDKDDEKEKEEAKEQKQKEKEEKEKDKQKEKEEKEKDKQKEKEEKEKDKQKEKEEKEKDKQKEKGEKDKDKQKEKEEKDKDKQKEKGEKDKEEGDEWIELEEEKEEKKNKNDNKNDKGKGRRVLCPGLRGMRYM